MKQGLKMQNTLHNKTIALAGILQAVTLIREFAHTGKLDNAAFQASIGSIFELHPQNPTDVFGDTKAISYGLDKLIHTLNPIPKIEELHLRHLFSLISIQKKLSRAPKLIEHLSERIQRTQKQVNYFSLTHPVVIANLADIYVSIVTQFRFRYFVVGNKRILSVNQNMEKIRALLLAAIRATVLWRQLGGSPIELIFSRRKLKTSAMDLIKNIDHFNPGTHL